MGRLKTLLGITAVTHVALARLISLDAKKCGDDAGKWIALTLLTGVVGAAKYVRDGRWGATAGKRT